MISFSKYHGCGNTFVIVKEEDIKHVEYAKIAMQMCNANTGIGADGFMIVKQNPLTMLFYNQDGSVSPMCGNGIRCFAKYVVDQQLVKEDRFEVVTKAGIMVVDIVNTQNFKVKINMGKESYEHALLHLNPKIHVPSPLVNYQIDERYEIFSVFIGTIHTVIFVEDISALDVQKEGEYLCHHPLFMQQSNINFVEVIKEDCLKVSTYERGVGPTLACGTGCCASAIFAHQIKGCNSVVDVILTLGQLRINIQEDIYMEGPAIKIADGFFEEGKIC